MSERIFSAQSLTKVYASGETEVRALRDLNLEVWAGEVVVLLGPSGSGKSTLLNIWNAENVLSIPVAALFRRGDDWAAFVVKDGRGAHNHGEDWSPQPSRQMPIP